MFSLKCCITSIKNAWNTKYDLVTAEPPFSVKMILCTRQDLERECSILQYVTVGLDVYQVCHCRSLCQKLALFLSLPSIEVKISGECWDILLSQQMLDAIITLFIRILSFSKTVHRCILHSTQSNCCNGKLWTSFCLSYGPITVQSFTRLSDLELLNAHSWGCSDTRHHAQPTHVQCKHAPILLSVCSSLADHAHHHQPASQYHRPASHAHHRHSLHLHHTHLWF